MRHPARAYQDPRRRQGTEEAAIGPKTTVPKTIESPPSAGGPVDHELLLLGRTVAVVAVDVHSMSVCQLREHITRAGLSHAACVDKSELCDLAEKAKVKVDKVHHVDETICTAAWNVDPSRLRLSKRDSSKKLTPIVVFYRV